MNDDLRQRLQTIFDQVDGGSATDMWTMLDEAIDEGELTREEVRENEMAIATFFDDHWFTCTQCGWTQPISQMGEDVNGELACEDCSPLED